MSVVGASVGIAGASFTLILSLTTGIIKKLLIITRNKTKKHDKILMLAKSTLNSIETLVSQALIDMEISHEKFITIKEKDKYEKMEENVRNMSQKLEEKQENMRINGVNSRTKTKNKKTKQNKKQKRSDRQFAQLVICQLQKKNFFLVYV